MDESASGTPEPSVIDSAEADRLEAAFTPLVQAVRRLVDVTIRSQVDADVMADATARITEVTDRLSTVLHAGPLGIQHTSDGRELVWGNAAIGLRNALAPPLVLQHGPGAQTRADVKLGAAYEGPEGLVHGGVCALLLDEVMGATAYRHHGPIYTGTLELRYLRPTQLNRPLHVDAQLESIERNKLTVVGRIADDDGTTVQARGIFITPRWARVQSVNPSAIN